MLVAIGEITFIKKTNLLKTLAPAKHQSPMGCIHDLRDSRPLRRHAFGHNSSHAGKSSDEWLRILRRGDTDPGIGLRGFKHQAQTSRGGRRVMGADKTVAICAKLQPGFERDVQS